MDPNRYMVIQDEDSGSIYVAVYPPHGGPRGTVVRTETYIEGFLLADFDFEGNVVGIEIV